MDVVVRAWRVEDAEAMEAALEASLEHLRPWMAWAAEPPPGVAWRRGWIREQNEAEARGGDRVRGAFLADGTLVGDQPRTPRAPADTDVERIWRLTRAAYVARA